MKWKMRKSVVLAALLCVVMAGRISSQIANIQIHALNNDKFPQIDVVFDLRDNNGGPIDDLRLQQITVEEDGVPRKLTNLTSRVNDDVVISLALVIDVSGSSEGEPLKNAIQATNNLLDELDNMDRVAFVAVRPQVPINPAQLDPQHEVGFTTNRNKIRKAVNFLQIQGEQTALYNAMFKAVKLTAAENITKRAVIVMTDGRDFTNSVVTANDPITEANRNNIPIFTIGLGQPRDEAYLQRVAARTGGSFQATNNPEELALLFNEVLQALKQEYMLTYESGLSATDQAEHLLSLSIKTRGSVISSEEGFNLLSGISNGNLSPIPKSSATPRSTATFTPMPIGTPQVAQENEVVVTKQVVIATQTIAPTQTPIATPTESSTSIAPIANIEENKSLVERISDNPQPIMVVISILVLLILALLIFFIIQQRIKNKQQKGVSALDDESEEPAVTKYNLPTADKKSAPPGSEEQSTPVRSPSQANGVVNRTVKDNSIDPKSQVGTNSAAAAAKTATLLSDTDSKSIPQLIKVQNKQHFELSGDYVFVGRHSKSEILLMDETVSVRHAVIIQSEKKILIQDIGSTNGTFVNGNPIEGRTNLKDGDNLRFGNVEMLFRAAKEQ
ncbi:MAG: FHA domain-containing protein [Ardenticatenaceae bacterium]